MKDKDKKYVLGGGAATLGGGLAIKKSIPVITGRTIVYHGTDTENAKNIIREGLIHGKVPGAAEAFDPELAKHKIVYTAPKKWEATAYAIQAPMRRMMRGEENPGAHTILKAKIPLWKDKYKSKLVENPELRGAKNYDDFLEKLITRLKEQGKSVEVNKVENLKNNPIAKRLVKPIMYDMYKRSINFQESLGPEVFTKSKSYKKLGLEELREYMKADPKRFRRGVIGAGLGTAIAGAGLYGIYKGIKNRKKQV